MWTCPNRKQTTILNVVQKTGQQVTQNGYLQEIYHGTTTVLLTDHETKRKISQVKDPNCIISFSVSVSTLSKPEITILSMFNLSSANAFNLAMSKILSFGKELIILT